MPIMSWRRSTIQITRRPQTRKGLSRSHWLMKFCLRRISDWNMTNIEANHTIKNNIMMKARMRMKMNQIMLAIPTKGEEKNTEILNQAMNGTGLALTRSFFGELCV